MLSDAALKIFIALLGTTATAAPIAYTVIPLPITPVAINASEQVIGYAVVPGGNVHSFLYSAGTLTDFGAGVSAGSINANGDVTGSVVYGLYSHAFLYSNGQMKDLGSVGPTFSYGTGINDSQQITGAYQDAALLTRAFLYSNGQMKDLGTPAGIASKGNAINSSGQVAGNYYPGPDDLGRAFLYSAGQFVNLTDPKNGRSEALAINDKGQVTGLYTNHSGFLHGFLYDAGHLTDLGALDGVVSQGEAINNKGVVTGRSSSGNDSVGHAFIYTANTMFDLNDLISSGLGQGDYIFDAPGINDNGWIIAQSYNGFNYILVPATTSVPEPETLLLLSFGAGTIALSLIRLRPGVSHGRVRDEGGADQSERPQLQLES